MELYHWAGLAVGIIVIVGAFALAFRNGSLGVLHVVTIAIGAVLAGVPVISMTMNDGVISSVQVGQLKQATSDANGASQAQAQAITALNNRVTQLASIVSKIPVAAAAPGGGAAQPATPPVAGAVPSPSAAPVIISEKVLNDWNADVLRFKNLGAQVDLLNQKGHALTMSSIQALNPNPGK